MAKAWFVVHTYSGYENKVQKHVRMLVEKGTSRITCSTSRSRRRK